MVTVLKLWNEVKLNLTSAKIYLPEFVLFNLLVYLGAFFIVDEVSELTGLICFFILLSFIYLNITGSKRRAELGNVKDTIHNIRQSLYQSSDEITLHKNLSALQDEIRLMFQKGKNDIEYLKKLEKMRTEFLANVSHELRTPIFTIQGYLETLLDGGALDDPKVNRLFLEKAKQHTLNLSNLLSDLIDISMIETGEMRLSFRYFLINDMLQEVVDDFIPTAETKNIKLLYSIDKENLRLFGDKDKLRQVMSNLIQNAIKYTEEGEITVSVIEEGKYGRIIVRDTGVGIPENQIDRIFERFYRIDKARSRDIGGTGLGLAIVKHIIDAHSSKVEVKSQSGKGTEFSFLLKK